MPNSKKKSHLVIKTSPFHMIPVVFLPFFATASHLPSRPVPTHKGYFFTVFEAAFPPFVIVIQMVLLHVSPLIAT